MSTAILSKNEWKFSPQNIPGCQLWLDGADTTSLSYSGSSVTAWRDKSGNGYNMDMLTAAPAGYAQTYPTTGTPINGLNTVNFSPGAGLKQGTTLDGVKNFYWVGRVSSAGDTCYFMLGHDVVYDWHADTYEVGTYINAIYSQPGIYNATPVSQYGGGGMATVNTTFSALRFPVSGSVTFVSAAGITGTTRYQGLCHDRPGVHCGWCGDLAEVIIFSEVLTTAQHQQIEGYLAAKWGLQSQLPVTHPYSTMPAKSFPGLQLWLDAADPAGTGISASTGTIVATWTDKSGKGNNATSAGSDVITSESGLVFDGSSYFTVAGIAGTIVNTAFVIFIVETLTGDSGANFYFGDDNVNASGAARYSLHTGYRNTTNQTFSMYGSDLEDYAVSSTGSTRIWALYLPSVSSRNTRRNGNVDVTFGNYDRLLAFTAPVIGRVFGGNYFNGTISEILVFNQDIGLPAIQLIEKYLSTKWDVSLIATGNVAQLTKPPYARPFQPVDISGCQLWLDAADQSAITFSSGTTVSVWKDKSGNGNNGTANGTVIWDANGLGTNLPAMTFTNSQRFYGNISITGDQFTSFIIFNLDSATTGAGRLLSLAVNDAYDFNNNDYICIIKFNGDNIVNYRNGGEAYIAMTTSVNTLTTSWVDGSTSYVSAYGGTPGTTESSGNFAVSAYAVGDEAWINVDGGALIYGYVSEVIVFNRSLTTSQRQQVEAYLAWKWGLRANLPITHPGYTLPSYSPVFTPKSISGLYLWLDAADSSTLVMSGSSVTNWNDKSGNGFSAVPMDSAVTLLSRNNNPTVYLPSIRMSIANFTWNYAFTMIIACKCLYSNMMMGLGAGLESNAAWLGYAETGNWALLYMSNPYLSTIDPNYTAPNGDPSSVGPANQWFIFSIGYNNGEYLTNYAINGTPYNANPMTPQTGSQTGYLMINGLPSYPYDSDEIGEIVHFNYSISTYQRQQIEGYLAWKWGIASSLPSTHPFAKISP